MQTAVVARLLHCHRKGNRIERWVRPGVRALSLFACALWGTAAHGQAGCPAHDFNKDYNCPEGPVYAAPNWGNVPWVQPNSAETIQTGDLDGDGIDELVGRDAAGIHVHMYDAALGLWKPVLTTDGGDELVLQDFSDAQGWDLPKYYETIKLVRLEATSPLRLVARASSGLVVYQFTRGPDTTFGFPTGFWKPAASNASGPFDDGNEWNGAPYYQSLRYGMIDDTGKAAVVGWGAAGLSTFRWTGSGWTPLPSNPEFGDASSHAGAVISSQLARIGTKSVDKLLVMGSQGLSAFEFVSGSGWQSIFVNAGNTFCDPKTLSCEYTLQTATLDRSGVPVIIYKNSVCAAGQDGMVGFKWLESIGELSTVFSSGPFTDCPNQFPDPRNFRSIKAADLDGDGIDELIGRGPNGILAYSWNGTSGKWAKIVNNVPALSDPLWASDPAYWSSLRTAKVDGLKAALLARGTAGVRTWLYNGTTFARPKPYGSFPTLDASSYSAINNFLNLPHGVRASYTNGTSTFLLEQYISSLRDICQGETSANPPQFKTCNPPGSLLRGARPVPVVTVFTATVNQLLRELYYVIASNGYFDQLNAMQAQLFSQEGVEFPSIEDNLLLSEAKNSSLALNYLNLFSNILKFAGSLLGASQITLAGNAMAVGLSENALFARSDTAVLQQKYAEIQQTIASLQQQSQNSIAGSKVYVAGDYALLSKVGQLTASQVWRLDQPGYLSLSRYAFTIWVMQNALPILWEEFQVTGCGEQIPIGTSCFPPPDGLNMDVFANNPRGGVDFTGILPTLPNTSPCVSEGNQTICSWTDLPPVLKKFVFDPITPECMFSPGAGTGWVYPTPNLPGCSLDAGRLIFTSPQDWRFNVVPIDFISSAGLRP